MREPVPEEERDYDDTDSVAEVTELPPGARWLADLVPPDHEIDIPGVDPDDPRLSLGEMAVFRAEADKLMEADRAFDEEIAGELIFD